MNNRLSLAYKVAVMIKALIGAHLTAEMTGVNDEPPTADFELVTDDGRFRVTVQKLPSR